MRNSNLNKKLKEIIREDLMNQEGALGCDLHSYLFNTHQHFCTEGDAHEAVNRFNVYKAIRTVTRYEQLEFGEVYTKINPVEIANMLLYIAGIELLHESDTLNEKWDERLEESDLRQIRKELDSYICGLAEEQDLVEHLLETYDA